ncbi:MAG: hypothetical protein GDA38_27295 [Hormoscilla sp. SP12CHS1]|nr:hypothetical protein [Hormoscilla sp. SP12CHS1]
MKTIEIPTQTILEPLWDTWGRKKYAGAWDIAPACDFTSASPQEVNEWIATSLVDTLDAFSHLVRLGKMEFGAIYRDDVDNVVLEWHQELTYDSYIKQAIAQIREFPAPIYSLDMEVDLFAYCRTYESPDWPVRGWVRVPTSFSISGGMAEDLEPYLSFSIEHTLFCRWSAKGFDNNVLHSLNQPLLEKALRRWEKRVGSLVEFEGFSGIYKYGFQDE